MRSIYMKVGQHASLVGFGVQHGDMALGEEDSVLEEPTIKAFW